MKKGKAKKQNNYLSVMLVPHKTGKVKVIKFSNLYSKLVTVVIAFTASITLLVLYTIRTDKINQNLATYIQKLNDEKKVLNDQNSEKLKEIDQLKQKEEEYNVRFKDFTSKYKEITDTYIANKTSRSGDRDERSFANDINELKIILENIGQNTHAEIKAAEGIAETEVKLRDYIESMPTLWPTSGTVTSRFGDRVDPFWHITKFHSGIDIATSYGNDIKAAGNGKVTFSGYQTAYGYVVFIDHGRGVSTVYAHASRLIVKQGDEVKRGDVIAKVGNSGRSTGPHLHFEVRHDDNVVDPLKYLDSK